MSPGRTFDRVYRALKEKILCGAFAPGQPLEPAALGDALAASVTPVRDALHRLAGERLVETPRYDGFRIAYYSEPSARMLYRWRGLVAQMCVPRAPMPGTPRRGFHAGDVPKARDPLRDVLERLAAAATNAEAAHALLAADDRLFRFRDAERCVLGDRTDELRDIDLSLDAQQWPAVRAGLQRYHRACERAVAEIVSALTTLARS